MAIQLNGLNFRLILRNAYLYSVCLISLVIAIFATINLMRSVVNLVYPDSGYFGTPNEMLSKPGVTPEERKRIEKQARDSEHHQTVLSIVESSTAILITGPLYLYHWRRAQEERPIQPDTQKPETLVE